MERIGAILERERQLLEHLLFKLTETRLILEQDETRFLARATREVDRARTRTREIDLIRATTVAQVRPGATLRHLATTAPEPWPGILRDHHEVLTGLVAEIEVTAHRNAELARTGLDALHLARAGALASSAPSSSGGDAELARLALGVALESVLGTAARLRMPDLITFLR